MVHVECTHYFEMTYYPKKSWCYLRVAQSKGLQFYLTRSNAIILYNSLLAVCIEKVVIRKSGDELYSKTYQSPSIPQRIALKPNLHYGRQDTTSSDARTSVDHSSKHRETCGGGTCNESFRGEIDFRIQGLPHSTVQEQDHTRKATVKKVDAPESRSVASRPEAKSRVQSIQSREMIHSIGKRGVLSRFARSPSKYDATTVCIYWT